MTVPEDDIRKILEGLGPVEADPGFRARLRLSAQQAYGRSRAESGERRQTRDRRSPAQAGAGWLPWGVAVAASVMALALNLGSEFESTVETDGAALVQTDDGQWAKLVRGDSPANGEAYYAPRDQGLRLENAGARIEAADDAAVEILGVQALRVSPSGRYRVDTKQDRYEIQFSKGGRLLIRGRCRLDMDLTQGRPWARLQNGEGVYVAADGMRLALQAGRPVNLPIEVEQVPEATTQILAALADGQTLRNILPKHVSEQEIENINENIKGYLKLAERLNMRSSQDVKTLASLMPRLDARGKIMTWNFIKTNADHVELAPASRKTSEEDKVDDTVLVGTAENHVPGVSEGDTVSVLDRINRVYEITRRVDGTYRVEVGEDIRELTLKEMLETVPAEVVGGLPPRWGLEAPR